VPSAPAILDRFLKRAEIIAVHGNHQVLNGVNYTLTVKVQ